MTHDEHASTLPPEWVHPAYVWWPWRGIAVGIPVLASLTGAWFIGSDTRMVAQGLNVEETAALVWLTIYTAGNALVIGMSSGHLGKTLFAMLGGAFVSYLSVGCFSEYAVLAGHAFTLPVLFASLDRDATLRTRLTSIGIGIEAFLTGLRIAVPACLIFLVVLAPMVNAWPWCRMPAIILILTEFFALLNDRFMRNIFGYVQRGENVLPPEIPKPPPEPKLETMGELLKAKRSVYEEPVAPTAAPSVPKPAQSNSDQSYSEST